MQEAADVAAVTAVRMVPPLVVGAIAMVAAPQQLLPAAAVAVLALLGDIACVRERQSFTKLKLQQCAESFSLHDQILAWNELVKMV